jgi:Transposase DDE domain group 1
MVTEAINTARAAGASGEILVRGDSAYGTSAVVAACLKARARFSLVLAKNPAVTRAIATIAADAWRPVHYPGAVVDPDTGELISDAEVAFTAFTSTNQPATARLVVRRVRDRAELDELFPVWRHHPFLTNSDESTVSTVEADLTHRRHAAVVDVQPVMAETVECAELVPVGVRALEVLGPVFRSGRELVVHRAEVGLLVRGDRSPHRDQEVAVAVRIGVTQREGSLQVGADEALAEDLGRP